MGFGKSFGVQSVGCCSGERPWPNTSPPSQSIVRPHFGKSTRRVHIWHDLGSVRLQPNTAGMARRRSRRHGRQRRRGWPCQRQWARHEPWKRRVGRGPRMEPPPRLAVAVAAAKSRAWRVRTAATVHRLTSCTHVRTDDRGVVHSCEWAGAQVHRCAGDRPFSASTVGSGPGRHSVTP